MSEDYDFSDRTHEPTGYCEKHDLRWRNPRVNDITTFDREMAWSRHLGFPELPMTAYRKIYCMKCKPEKWGLIKGDQEASARAFLLNTGREMPDGFLGECDWNDG